VQANNSRRDEKIKGRVTTQFKGILMFWLAKLPVRETDENGRVPPVGTKPFSKEQLTNLDTIKTIVTAFGLWKQITNGSNPRMLMGMELVSLKGFNEFMKEYERLPYRSGHAEDNSIKLILITRIPNPIPEKVHVMLVNKKTEIADMTLADVVEVIRICIEDFCMEKMSIKKIIKNKADPKDCQCFSYVKQYGKPGKEEGSFQKIRKYWLRKSHHKYRKTIKNYWKKRTFQQRKKFGKQKQVGGKSCYLCGKARHFAKHCSQKKSKL
jgi:hypothetical protein